MKIFIISSIIIFTTLLICSCKPKNENQNVQNIDPNNIQLNDVIHDSFSKEQIEKITYVQKTFEEVYPVSLDETTINFKRDQNPDSEIEIWLQMANSYQKYIEENKNSDLETRKEVFKLILSRSMMPDEEAIKNAELKILNENQAHKILENFKENPKPIKVQTSN